LQTTNQLILVQKSRAELARELEKIDDQRRIRLLAELQDATVKLAGERAKLRGVEEKLQLAGLRPPRTSDSANKADITVFRTGISGKERHNVEADSELQPGGVLEGRRGRGPKCLAPLLLLLRAAISPTSECNPQGDLRTLIRNSHRSLVQRGVVFFILRLRC